MSGHFGRENTRVWWAGGGVFLDWEDCMCMDVAKREKKKPGCSESMEKS